MDFGQNLKFAKTFFIGKTRRETIFGVVFRVVGSKVEEKNSFDVFSSFWPKTHGLTPLDFGQNLKFAKTFFIGKKSRETMFGVVFQSSWEQSRREKQF